MCDMGMGLAPSGGFEPGAPSTVTTYTPTYISYAGQYTHMDAARLDDKRILRWGNSYGIRLTKAEVEALGLHEGDGVRVEVEPRRKKIDWDTFPSLNLGPGPHDLSTNHDDLDPRILTLHEELMERERLKREQTRRST